MARAHAADRCISCGPILRIRCAAQLRRHGNGVALVLIWLAALVSAILLHRSGAWFQSRVALFGLALAFGGAAGNLLDMLRYRYIVDFIEIGRWRIFNLADVAIVVGLTVGLCT